ncbi:hypothetical protein JMJ35_001452 [Cladonia borealis]|uniref:Amidohydrolase-related domain-containing protein n=1 Tax=Cladonia borealis TaxID=184061 RepID=A0AA39R5U1_9LECA|nr:hypothetical protein JMJ35_001452 [Cladonia borealis]
MERKKVDVISGARILFEGWDPSRRYDVILDDSNVKEITPYDPGPRASAGGNVLDATNHLLAPSLCHAHIHLDKCFLLSDPKYADLEIVKGDFKEALELTSKAKSRFEKDDLIRRGKWLIAESIAAGVTHMRAFAEVDYIVEFKCLDAAIELKKSFADACEIQICAFAQEPIYSGKHLEVNRNLLERAIANDNVEVLGTTPYVETSSLASSQNMLWALQTAKTHKKHLDLHLDYNLNPKEHSQTLDFLTKAQNYLPWPEKKTIALGHCTRLTLFGQNGWQSQLNMMQGSLPIFFVGLPTSDMYIQGRPKADEGGGQRPRGTLQIPQMINKYGLNGAISINNVGNAFTPHGSCDPLSIASVGVGIYHAGTKADAQLLYECISTRAKEAIGYRSSPFAGGEEANFVLFDVGVVEGMLSRQRGRRTMQEVVYDPPRERRTVYKGHLISI